VEVYLAEFVGTLILILLGDGVVAGVLLRESKAEGAGWVAICFGWGLGVAIAVYAVGAISGAHINPAVTVGLASIGVHPWALVPGYIIAQLLGGFVGAVLVWLAYLPHWRQTEDPELKLATFCTIPAIRNFAANFVTEVIATAMLVFGVVAIVANVQRLAEAGTVDVSAVYLIGLLPLIVGLLVVVIGFSLGGPTGYAINPARDLAPRIAHAVLPIAGKGGSDWSYAWIPVVAPLIGGVLGALAYSVLGFGGI
jgi:glycerol uptake facilitator protein